MKPFHQAVLINSTPPVIWNYLTDPELMKQWMGEPEMQLQVKTEWEVGTPIIITGFHHVNFENRGLVLRFEPNKVVSYSHLSSVSRLPALKENYSVFAFLLSSIENKTLLEVTVENFPTEIIYKHLVLYWKSTAGLLKEIIEKNEEQREPKS